MASARRPADFLGNIATGVGFGLSNTIASALLLPTTRSATYVTNAFAKTVYPSVEQALFLRWSGLCTDAQLQDFFEIYGVDTGLAPGSDADTTWWRDYILYARPQLSIDTALRQRALGRITPAQADDTIRYHGYGLQWMRDAISSDTDSIGVSELLLRWWRGEITEVQLGNYLAHAGFQNADMVDLLKSTRTTYSIGDYLRLYWQGMQTWDNVREHAKRVGLRLESDIDKLQGQRVNWPGAGEALQLAVASHPAFNYTARMQLDNEFPGELEGLLRASGATWNPADGNPALWQRAGETLSQWYWRSHWNKLDPQTAFIFARRLRPTGGANNGPRIPGVTPFTDQDLDGSLAVAGVPPGIRDAYRAVSYSIPQRLYVKRLYAENIIDLAEATEMLQDQGYSRDNASKLATLVHKETVTDRINKVRPVTVSQIKDAYRIGVIGRDVAKQNLYIASLTDPDQIKAQISLPIGTYADGGLLEPFIEAGLRAIDTDIAAELSKQGIEVYHKAYLRGEIDANNARNSLISMGIIFDRATQYVQLWTYELAAEGVELSAAKLVDYYISHLIDQNTLFSRLIGLHYTPHDAQLIIASANLKLSEAAAKLQEKIGKAQEQQHKQLAAAAQQLQKQQASLSKQLCRSSSKSQLVAWATKRIIDYPSAFDRLTQCGMTPDDALNALTAAADKKGGLTREQIKEKIGPAFAGTESNGQTTSAT